MLDAGQSMANPPALSKVTPRLLLQGNSPVTVRNAVYRIQDESGVGSKQEIVVWAVRNGLLDDMEPNGMYRTSTLT